MVERRHDKSRGGCLGNNDTIGNVLASSAQLKWSGVAGFGWFWLKMTVFSTFWRFSVKSLDSGRVFGP